MRKLHRNFPATCFSNCTEFCGCYGGRSRRRWRCLTSFYCVDENSGNVVGDGKRFTGGESGECGTGEAKRVTVIRVRRCEVVASVNCFLHETAAFFAPPYRFFVVEFGRRATHCFRSYIYTVYYTRISTCACVYSSCNKQKQMLK